MKRYYNIVIECLKTGKLTIEVNTTEVALAIDKLQTISNNFDLWIKDGTYKVYMTTYEG